MTGQTDEYGEWGDLHGAQMEQQAAEDYGDVDGVHVAGRADLLTLVCRTPRGQVTTLGELLGDLALEVETVAGWRPIGSLTFGDLGTAPRRT
jgi:hypothetical protein